MQKVSELFIRNIQNLPIWAQQVIAKELSEDLSAKLTEFNNLINNDVMFQYMLPSLTIKGRQELQDKSLKLSESYYTFLQDINEGNSIFEITIKNNWALADSAKIFTRLDELEFVKIPQNCTSSCYAVILFIAGKIKTGEFLKRIGKIDVGQLEQALRYQKQLNEEGRHVKMASLLIKMGVITNQGLDSLFLLKEEAKKRVPVSIGLTSIKYDDKEQEQDYTQRLQKELARLENENAIMKKRLKKLLNME